MNFSDTSFGPNRDSISARATLWRSRSGDSIPVARGDVDEPDRVRIINETLSRLNGDGFSAESSPAARSGNEKALSTRREAIKTPRFT